MNENRLLLEKWAPYHKEIVQSLDSLRTDEKFIEKYISDKTILLKQILTKGTFMGRMPTNDAWDIAKSHPLIVHFDYDKVLLLSKIYNQQVSTFEPVAKIPEAIFSPNLKSKEEARQNLHTFHNRMREIYAREKQMLEYYDEAQKEFNLKDVPSNK